MMGYQGYGMMSSWGVLGILTWLLLVVFLALGAIYFWKGISKGNKK